MHIIFSPFYDQGTYRPYEVGQVLLDELVVGTKGLLSELELRSGMSGREIAQFTRVVEYYKAIKAVLATGYKPFFEESFGKDELGVSGELLRWRDALVMAGWGPEVQSSASVAYKFRDIAKVEGHFHCPGEADRWQALKEVKGYLSGSTGEGYCGRSGGHRCQDILCSPGWWRRAKSEGFRERFTVPQPV